MGFHEYRIVEKMATGAFGIVFRVRRTTDDTELVMKRIPLADLTPEQRRDSAQEVAVMQELTHPCIVAQRDAFLYNNSDLCLVLDYFDGGDMDERLAAQREVNKYFSFNEVMLWFVQLVLGAQYLHSHHVIHRDIKTHNVFLRRRDSTVALGDFGISERIPTPSNATRSVTSVAPSPLSQKSSARGDLLSAGPHRATGYSQLSNSPSKLSQQLLLPAHLGHFASNTNHQNSSYRSHDAGLPMEAAMKGTPLYMAPEVLQGGEASPKSDVWSLGCVLYELLTLRHPFEARDLASLVMRVSRGQREPLPSHYPVAVQQVINQMLDLDAAKRPSCDEVLHIPCIRAYVELWKTLRTPLDAQNSASEAALVAQLQAMEPRPTGGRRGSRVSAPSSPVVHYSDVERDLRRPSCSPAEEKEVVDEKARVAAREAAVAMELDAQRAPSGLLLRGTSTYSGAGMGTFFVGAGGQNDFFSDSTAVKGYGLSQRDGGVGLRDHPSTAPADWPMSRRLSSASAAVPPLGEQQLFIRGRSPPLRSSSSASQQWSSAPDGDHDTSPAPPSPAKRRGSRPTRQQQRRPSLTKAKKTKGKKLKKGSPRRVSGAATPTKSSRPSVVSPPSTASAASTPPTSPPRFQTIGEEALFLRDYPNVSDVVGAPLAIIEAELRRMQQVVQQRMGHQRLLEDMQVLHQRHGSGLLRSMPRSLQVLATATAGTASYAVDALQGTNGGGGQRPSSLTPAAAASPEEAFAAMVGELHVQRQRRLSSLVESELQTSDLPVGRPSPPKVKYLRERSAQMLLAAQAEVAASRSTAGGATARPGRAALAFPLSSPSRAADPVAMLSLSSTSVGWQRYAERRNALLAELLRIFGAPTLRAVYEYYSSCSLLQRSAAVVRQLVSDRQKWIALPNVEELVVLDRNILRFDTPGE